MSLHLLPFLSSLLVWASFHPVNAGPLAWVALVPLALHARRETRGGRAVLVSWLAGSLMFAFLFSWVRFSWWAAPPLIGLYMGLYWGLFTWILRRLPSWPLALSLPVAWTTADLARATVFEGFPYALLGYTQHAMPTLIQVSDLGGVWLVGALLAAVNGAVVQSIETRAVPRRAAATLSVLLLLSLVYGGARLSTLELEEGPVVAVIQPNIPQDVRVLAESHHEEDQRVFRVHLDLSKEAMKAAPRPELVIWPESATFHQMVWDTPKKRWLKTADFESLAGVPAALGVPLLTGALVHDLVARDGGYGRECRECLKPGAAVPSLDAILPACEACGGRSRFSTEPTNSALLLLPDGTVAGRYDKTHLVAFSERMPFNWILPVDRWVAAQLNIGRVSAFKPGREIPAWDVAGTRLGAKVCYEAAYSDISRILAGKGGRIVVNISNEGWFKESAELDLMLGMAVFRAIENRVHCVRATNNGISAFIEPTGRIQAAVEDESGDRKGVRGILAGRPRLAKSRTLQGFVGDGAAWLAALAAAAGILAARFRRVC